MHKLTFAETPKTRTEFVKKWNTDHAFKARAVYSGFNVIADNVIFPNGMVADKKIR